MRIFYVALMTAFIVVAPLAINSAYAFSVDDKTANNNDGSAKFSDPDETLPSPNMHDEGLQPGMNLVPNGMPNTNSTPFGVRSNVSPDAFQRSMSNRQQQ